MNPKEIDKINNFSHSQMIQYFEHYCSNGNLDAIKYILNSPDIKNPLNIYIHGDDAILQACRHGHLDVVKYITSSSELEHHVAYSDKIDEGFNWAGENGHMDIIKYLIFDYKINCSKKINEYLGQSLLCDEIEDMFNLRDLHTEINQILPVNIEHKINKKIKI